MDKTATTTQSNKDDTKRQVERVFDGSRLSPFKSENRHAVKLVNLYDNGNQQECYKLISEPPADLESKWLGDRMEKLWERELEKRGPVKASLTLALFRLMWWDKLELLLWSLVGRLLMTMVMLESIWKILILVQERDDSRSHRRQILIRAAASGNVSGQQMLNGEFVMHLEGDDTVVQQYNENWYNILFSLLWLFIANCVYQISSLLQKVKQQRCGLKCRVALIELINRKSLKINLSTSIKESSSRAIGLISNDVSFVETANMGMYNIIVGPMSLIVISVWLAQTQVGWQPVAFTLPVLFSFVAIQLYLPKVYDRITVRKKEVTNKRIEAISAFLSSIKIVKMYAWEPKFKERIQELRAKETKEIKKLDLYDIINNTLYFAADKLLALIVYFAHILIFRQFNAQLLFVTPLAYSFIKSESILWFPAALKRTTEMLVGMRNIKEYLLLDEIKDQRVQMPGGRLSVSMGPGAGAGAISVKVHHLAGQHLSISFSSQSCEISAKNDKEPRRLVNIIEDLNFDLQSGDRVFVVGAVGSGKSTLLLSLLGETRLSSGLLTVTSGTKFAYASQEPCVFPDSIKNNILNGRPLDTNRYQQVVAACSLTYDLSLLPQGHETIVGPRGVSLSGGQKARLSLARAVYSQADVYLLDDPLSAVDSRVANDMFANCICGFLADKLVILATHQLQFISQSNKVIILERNQVPLFGATKQLMDEPKLRSLLIDCKQRQARSAADSSPVAGDSKVAFGSMNNDQQAISVRETMQDKPASDEKSAERKKAKREESGYLFLLKCVANPLLIAGLVLISICCIVAIAFCDFYHIIWASNVMHLQLDYDGVASSESTIDLLIDYTLFYLLIVLIMLALYCSALHLCRIGLRDALQKMHDLLTDALFRAKMSFYDFCKTGELTSRYAGDFAELDLKFLLYISHIFSFALCIMASLVTLTIIKPLQLLPIIVSFCLSAPIAACSRDRLITLRNLSRALLSPLYTTLALSVDELNTIRSEPDHLISLRRRLRAELNKSTSISLISFSCDARMGIHLKYMSQSLLGAMFAIYFGLYADQLSVPTTGTFLLISLGSIGIIPMAIEFWFFIETGMVCVRNIRQYTQLEPESDEPMSTTSTKRITDNKNNNNNKRKKIKSTEIVMYPPRRWERGDVEFKQVTMYYSTVVASGGAEKQRPALRGLSFTIRGGERVGIVGRTGAGKSSIVSALYRLYPFEGTVEIDGQDTKQLPLGQLRASLGVIPQDPVLFCDSLRKNLDPFGCYSDTDLWRTLKVVDLADFVRDKLHFGLDQQVSGGGRNFSAGQRQLVCLARAVLRSPRVLLIDEATANVDNETDALIQRTIREHFKSSTIITIAHRLNTVLDYDRVMVLDAGEVREFDSVERLVELDNGIFRQMLQNQSSSEL